MRTRWYILLRQTRPLQRIQRAAFARCSRRRIPSIGVAPGAKGRQLCRERSPRDIEKTYPRSQFVAKLRRLADAIESERPFTIQVAGERLRIPADAAFNVEHERQGGEDELEFQLRWTR